MPFNPNVAPNPLDETAMADISFDGVPLHAPTEARPVDLGTMHDMVNARYVAEVASARDQYSGKPHLEALADIRERRLREAAGVVGGLITKYDDESLGRASSSDVLEEMSSPDWTSETAAQVQDPAVLKAIAGIRKHLRDETTVSRPGPYNV